MLKRFVAGLAGLAVVSASLFASGQAPVLPQKTAAVASIDRHAAELARLSDQVWAYAETALLETKSADAIAAFAEAQGFRVRRGVAEMPTAFVAELRAGRAGHRRPRRIRRAARNLPEGRTGEGGARGWRPGTRVRAQPAGRRRPRRGAGDQGADGRGEDRRHHPLLRHSGRGGLGGKIYMLRAGLFKDVDVVTSWHPGDETSADTTSSQAIVNFIVEFHGRTAHAAADPWNGRSAVDGLGDLHPCDQLPARARQAHGPDSLLDRQGRRRAERRARLREALVLGARL